MLRGGEINKDDPFGRGEGGKRLEDAVKDSFISAESQEGMYYAKRNEDIYIYVHISNPDGFEILSFTLNGVKYSSYMFEEGSDLETLVLKYNVGDVEGVQEYTIDAIKYVDGEDIKDVRMEGDRTVKVTVYPEQQPAADITGESIGFTEVGFDVSVTDELGLISDSEGELYAVLYDGEQLVYSNKINATDKVSFVDLAPDTLYQYAIIGVYDALDGNGKAAHILTENAFYTEAVLAFENVAVTGLTADFSLVWGEGFENESILSIALYEGENKLRDIATDATGIEPLPMEKELKIVAEYTHKGETRAAVYDIPAIKQSEGLTVMGGKVIGRGDCNDTELYINMPIGEDAFQGDRAIEKVYLGSNVTSVDGWAFALCDNLTEVVISEGLVDIGQCAFGGIPIKQIIIPNSVEFIAWNAFYGCKSLKTIYMEAASIPGGWESNWGDIIWGYKGTQSE